MRLVTSLLLDEIDSLSPDSRVLVLGGEAALPNGMSGRVTWVPTDLREQEQAVPHVVVGDNTAHVEADTVIVPSPPERDLARRWLLVAAGALRPGGNLIVAGANAEGVKSFIGDARSLFGAPIGAYPLRKHRIARFRRPETMPEPPAWATEPGVAPGTWTSFDLDVDGTVVTLETQAGVFAGDRLDAGTRLLLEQMTVPEGGRVLDVGCGAGVIGVAAAMRGAAHVDLVDANLLAVEAAARNIARLEMTGRAVASDVFSAVPDKRYDLVVSNPPFHRGKEVDLSVADRLIAEAPRHLAPGGRLLVVANAFLAYRASLERVFRSVETIAETRQYHVLEGREPR